MRTHEPWPGFLLFLVGFTAVVLAVVGGLPWFVPVMPSLTAGAAIAVLGLASSVRAMLVEPPAPVAKPAHVAFLERPRHEPPIPARRPRRAAEVAAEAAAVAAASAAAEPARPPSAEEKKIDSLEGEIRNLSRQIDRAKVMYGTGKLSRDGYAAYVRDLETKRGELEAERVRLQMESGHLV